MAQYDPQRSRTRHRKADEEGPAPVDALLGPAPPAAERAPSTVEPAPLSPEPPSLVDLDLQPLDLERLDLERLEPETALDVARSLTSRGPAIWMATVTAVVATFGLLLLVLRGRRRGRRDRRGRRPRVDA